MGGNPSGSINEGDPANPSAEGKPLSRKNPQLAAGEYPQQAKKGIHIPQLNRGETPQLAFTIAERGKPSTGKKGNSL